MTINNLTVVMPTPPDPAVDNDDAFTAKASATTLAEKQLADQLTVIIPQMNSDIAAAVAAVAIALQAAASAVNGPGTSGTSTTSLAIGSGTKTFTTETGKNWVLGQPVVIASTASPTNQMAGVVTAYNSATGAMTVQVSNFTGSGTFAAWTVALTGPVQPTPVEILATTGTGTAYAITPGVPATLYQAGMSFFVNFAVASGASPTLNVSGLGAFINLVKELNDGTYVNIGAGDIPAGHRSRVTLLNGAQALVERMPNPGRLIAVRVFLATQVYTKTPGTNAVVVKAQAPGGAGGGCVLTGAGQIAAGGGGGGGGYAESYLTAGFDGQTITIGPAGVPAAGAAGGGAGGSVSFGALLSATGGQGGQAGSVVGVGTITFVGGGPGGIGTGGNIVNSKGQPGGFGIYGSSVPKSGAGGASMLGGGAIEVSGTSPGVAANSPGAGGSGSSNLPSAAANAGGAAGAGSVTVWEYA